MDWDEADQIQNLDLSSLGPTPCLENPQIVTDEYNDYDVLFSIGSYTSDSTYFTGEIGCPTLNDSSSNGCGFEPAQGTVLTPITGGGASTLNTGNPDNNYMIWANYDGSIRDDWVGPTSACNPEPPDGC